MQPTVVVEERRPGSRASDPRESMEWLLGKCERDVINCCAARRGQSFMRNGWTEDVAGRSLVSESLNGAKNERVGLTRLAQLAIALEGHDLAPVSLQDSLGHAVGHS